MPILVPIHCVFRSSLFALGKSSVARELAENLISPRPRGSREAWFRHPRSLHPRSETSSIAPTAIAFTKRLASPPPPPPRSRLALTAREGADRVERSAPLGLGPTGQGARELAREQPCCHFLCAGGRAGRAPPARAQPLACSAPGAWPCNFPYDPGPNGFPSFQRPSAGQLGEAENHLKCTNIIH